MQDTIKLIEGDDKVYNKLIIRIRGKYDAGKAFDIKSRKAYIPKNVIKLQKRKCLN